MEKRQTLFRGQISQLVRRATVEGVTFPIVSILQNYPQAIGSLS